MISRRSIPITDEDNVGTLFEKLALVGRDLLLDTLPAYIAGDIKPEPQDPSQVTFSPNIKPEEEKLDWTKTNRQLFNQIRGMNRGLLPILSLRVTALRFMKPYQ